MKKTVLCFVFALAGLSLQLEAQEGYVPTKENLENREWFQDAKYGLFIHWGLYSQLGGGGDRGIAEWIMNNKNIPIVQYEKLPGFFNPQDFDPAAWVSMVKKAGMKYITITTKHHDGFAMYDSRVSDYNIVDATPYGKDVIGMLKEECDRQGIKLFFYHSQLDWHHPEYFPHGRTGTAIPGRSQEGDMNKYIDYMNTQLTELLTQYGEIGGIWFDGMWDKPDAEWRLGETYALIHKLQPGTLIGSNHHKMPYPGEDFMMFERDLPGENSMGFNNTGISDKVPLEMCETMNGSWGFNLVDQNYKSVDRLVSTMVRAAGFGANFLLNTGPMPNGRIQPENVDTLMAIGKWLEVNGESIYGTRRGPVKPQEWGAITSKANTLYVHVLDHEGGEILIPDYQPGIAKAVYFSDGAKVEWMKSKRGILINVPKERMKGIDTIIVLTLKD
ncbi:MAG: alpha-L-fucosidase [Bacteroidetes bacterium]|nr:MAG: alpha-L-fucosidase [Bacteroidota bacterium]